MKGICLELDSGTYTGKVRAHNGYYAGAFPSSAGQPSRTSRKHVIHPVPRGGDDVASHR